MTPEAELSAECEVAKRDGYEDLHDECRQKDIPLPYGGGILLQRRCGCGCHRPKGQRARSPQQVRERNIERVGQ